MIKGLGHLIRFMFGGKTPLPASAVVVVGAEQQDLVEAPAASSDLLRRAMDAASVPLPEADLEQLDKVEQEPAPEMPFDPLPSLFLQGLTPERVDSVPETIIDSPDQEMVGSVLEETPVQPDAAPVEDPELDHSWLTQEWVEIEISSEPAPPFVSAIQPAEPSALEDQADPEREALVEAAFELANELLKEAPLEALEPEVPEPQMIVEPVSEIAAATKPAKKPAKKTVPAKKKTATSKRTKVPSAGLALPLPDDAVYLTDAVVWSQCGSWREFWLPPTDANTSQRLDEFRQMAASGKLTIWGQPEGTQTWEAIDPSHWKKNGFEPLSFLAGRENAFTETKPAAAKTKKAVLPVKISSLKVSQAKVEELWRSAAARAAA